MNPGARFLWDPSSQVIVMDNLFRILRWPLAAIRVHLQMTNALFCQLYVHFLWDSIHYAPRYILGWFVSATSKPTSVLAQWKQRPHATPQHIWLQTSIVSTARSLSHLIVQISIKNITTFFCGWDNCTHPVGFSQKAQLITYSVCASAEEALPVYNLVDLFLFGDSCCSWTNITRFSATRFSRKQEAIRNVNSNNGRKYNCSFW